MRLKKLFVALLASGELLTTVQFGWSQNTLADPSFAVGSGADAGVFAILPRTDGKIMVGGAFTVIAGNTNLHLALLDSNGIPDSSFHADTDNTVWHLLQQPDGKILVAGDFTNLQGTTCYQLGRLLTNGMVDPEFNAGTNFLEDGSIFTIALQPDGKILAATAAFSEEAYSRLWRLNSDGRLDDSFVQTNFFNSWHIHTLLVRTNGAIWAGGGFSDVNGNDRPSLAVLDSTGQLRTNKISPTLISGSDIFSLVELANGNVLLGGKLIQPTNTTYFAQLTPQSEWATNFLSPILDGGGLSSDFISTAMIQPDGKILAGGSFYDVNGYWRRNIMRLNANGQVDSCFDPGLGLLGFDWPQTIVQQPDGRILVGGRFAGADSADTRNIARLLPGGDCDATRVYIKTLPQSNYQFVAGTYPPGGTSYLQFSTNLVDWVDVVTTTGSYLYYGNSYSPDFPSVFYRVKKIF